VKKNVIKVAKCKQCSIWLQYKILIHFNCTHCQKATDEKEGSDNWLMSNFLDTVEVHQNLNTNKSTIGL
jgi:hypothetical protein